MNIKIELIAAVILALAATQTLVPPEARADVTLGAAAQTAISTIRPKEGCAADAKQQCAGMTSSAARLQCLQAHPDNVSDACKAAMAQNPAHGIARHMGDEQDPVLLKNPAITPPPIPTMPNLPLTPAATSQPAPTMPPAILAPPTVILATPIGRPN